MGTTEDVRITACRIGLAIDDGDLERAGDGIAALRERPGEQPLAATLLVRLGQARLAAGDAPAALEAARAALALDGAVAGGHELGARAAALAGAHAEAAQHLAPLAARDDPEAAIRLARALKRAGDLRGARTTAARAVRCDAGGTSLATAADLFALLPPPENAPRIRAAFVGSSTLEPVASAFSALAAAEGLVPETWVAPFGQYAEQMLDPASELYRFRPQLLVVAVAGQALLPQLYTDPLALDDDARRQAAESAAQDLVSMVSAVRRQSEATVLVHLALTPARSPVGILDRNLRFGQAEAVAHFNATVSAAAREMAGVNPLDLDRLVAAIGRGAFDARAELIARIEAGPRLARSLGETYLAAARALLGKSRKCLVVDLDNTLWGGVVGEDGPTGIQLGHDFPGNAYRAVQQELLALKRRGVLLAVNSKNNHADAMEVLTSHPEMLLRPGDFAAMRINWRDKHLNLAEIAEELNIGLDAIVFLDDSPTECAMVRAALPQVEVVHLDGDPAHFAGRIRDLTLFETLQLTDEDLRRTEMYVQGRERAEWERAHATSIEEHLRDLELAVEVAPVTDHGAGRVAQLLAKTNQFNTTTLRMPEEAVHQWAAGDGRGVLCARVRDRFGDHGLVGVVLWSSEGTTATIDAFVLSCRVLGRGVERAVLAAVVEEARERGARDLRAPFYPTAKNTPAAGLYPDNGFTRVSSTEWALDLRQGTVAPPAWIALTTTRPAATRPPLTRIPEVSLVS